MTTTWIESDGLPLYVRAWLAENEKAVVLRIHGFGETCDKYTVLAERFNAQGISVVSFDQRGAGHTAKSKSDIGLTGEQFVYKDLDVVLENTMETHKCPIFLMGHSMGGGIVLNYAVVGKHRNELAGIIASAPLITLSPETNPNFLLRAILPFLARLLPNYKQDTSLNINYVSHDKEAVASIIADPYCSTVCSARQMNDMINRGAKLLNPDFLSRSADIPTFVFHGTEDKINWFNSSKKYVDLLPAKDKTFLPVQGAYHDIDLETDEYRLPTEKATIDWILHHLTS
ncbi:hypothetical protein CANCADRAFT_26096 [Tortispora caseinolytica NRRL Y-17796]|uniref:Serine aminopeptidase S33 domain-containing protein n=1 Tax=Tortispora caseinolytica NRRL Y-17796 TaxID=767744 RepID=A0A1E4THZ3_9ASCO|nr:hypothetical protein CANCADRAFT_26096 [Tortispora caseinolytica NRRL Y-17796]